MASRFQYVGNRPINYQELTDPKMLDLDKKLKKYGWYHRAEGKEGITLIGVHNDTDFLDLLNKWNSMGSEFVYFPVGS